MSMTTEVQTKSNEMWIWVGVAILAGLIIAVTIFYAS
jgi:IS1 family transposase